MGDMTYSWRTAQLLYPVMVFTTLKLLRLPSDRDTSALKGNSDIKYLWGTLSVVLVMTGSAGLLLTIGLVEKEGISLPLVYNLLTPANLSTLCIFLWCVFTVWDLVRIKAPGIGLRGGLPCVFIISALCGSPAALAFLWMWREWALERGRKKVNSS